MTADELKALAWAGQEPPDLPAHEKLYFVRTSRIYEMFRNGFMPEDKAVAEMKSALCEFDKYNRIAEAEFKRAKHSANYFKGIELAASAFRKDRTIDNAVRLLNCIDGVS